MEKVIYLEPDDEITSVIDKIKKVNQGRVILVVPKAATILQSIVNLKILKNQALRLGKDISVVTSDETGRNLASQIGLTVYRDLAKRPVSSQGERPVSSQGERPIPGEKISEEKKEPPKMQEEAKEIPPEPEISKRMIDIRPSGVKFAPYKDEKRAGLGVGSVPKSSLDAGLLKKLKIAAIILLVVALFEGIFAYFYLPRANCEIILKAEKLDKTYQVLAQKGAALDEKTGTIPANLYTLEKEGSKDFPTTGTKDVGEKAKGTISVINETGIDQPLVATTRFVSANNLVFRSTAAVTVPKAYLDPGGNKVNGSANISLVADATGEAYNIGSSNFSIPGLPAATQTKIYGRSSAGMSGGSSRKIKIVSEADLKAAETGFLNELVASSQAEIKNQSANDELIIDGSAGGTVVSGAANPAVGAEAETFNYSLKATISLLTVKKADFFNILNNKINEEMPQDKELLLSELEKNTENKVLSLDLAGQKMAVSSRVTAPVVAKMDNLALKNNLHAKSAAAAVSYLKSFNEIYDAKVSLWPFFSRKVPANNKRIFINTSYHLTP